MPHVEHFASTIYAFMQSADESNAPGSLLYISFALRHCIVTYNRVKMTAEMFSPCKAPHPVIRTPATSIANFSFLYPNG